MLHGVRAPMPIYVLSRLGRGRRETLPAYSCDVVDRVPVMMPKMMTRGGWAPVWVLCVSAGAAVPPGISYLPETPFRGDAIDDRRDGLGGDDFLNVFSYRPPFEWEEYWEAGALKYRGTAGSTAKDVFWVDHRIHFAYDYTEWCGFHAQAVEAEDFDSRYRRFELGAHIDVRPWLRLGVYGEVVPDKGDNDLGLSVTFQNVLDQRVTLGVEFTDVLMNKKGETQDWEYTRQPQSYWLNVKGALGPRIRWNWGVRANAPLTLEDSTRRLTFRYAQLSAYGRVTARVTERLQCALYWGGEGTDKAHRPWDGSEYLQRDSWRRVFQGRFEARYTLDPAIVPYVGVRVFRVADKKRFSEEPSWPSDVHRHREYLCYLGAKLVLSPLLTFRPEVILGHQDRVLRAAQPGGRRLNEHAFAGKLSAPLELTFTDRGRAIASVSLDLDEMKFGGGMVGFQISF